MRTVAPGKLVLSGAYAVLEGAPAIVTAVDRYVIADSSREAEFLTPEVQCAIGERKAPAFDASSLRADGRKLGIGSSAAILVASMAALLMDDEPEIDGTNLAERIFPNAIVAHRRAQGGGSGVDVAASAYGGTIACVMRGELLEVRAHKLANGLVVDSYSAGQAASTAGMLKAVRAFAASEPGAYAAIMGALKEFANDAVLASTTGDFVRALRGQAIGLAALGDGAGVPIVPREVRDVADAAIGDGVVVMPSGAGGGDVVVSVGEREACDRWSGALGSAGLKGLGLGIGARGVHGIEGQVEAARPVQSLRWPRSR